MHTLSNQTIDPEKAKEKIRFSPVAWQHISFIGKYEFYNRGYIVNIQWLIEIIVADLKIDIRATGHE